MKCLKDGSFQMWPVSVFYSMDHEFWQRLIRGSHVLPNVLYNEICNDLCRYGKFKEELEFGIGWKKMSQKWICSLVVP